MPDRLQGVAVIGQLGFLLTDERLYVRYLHTDRETRRRDRGPSLPGRKRGRPRKA